jgi:hypothetical protein
MKIFLLLKLEFISRSFQRIAFPALGIYYRGKLQFKNDVYILVLVVCLFGEYWNEIYRSEHIVFYLLIFFTTVW